MKLCIALPTHDGRIHVLGAFALNHTIGMLAMKGIETQIVFMQSSDIAQARALLAQQFLEDTDCSHMLMVDSDLSFDPQAPIKLLESGHDLCGGVYPKKKLGNDPEFTVEYDGPSINGYRKARYIGGGLMMIRRHVFTKIRAKFPELTATDVKTGKTFTSYFQNGIIDGRYRSEDAAICYRWQLCGGDVWALEDCSFSHFGPFGWGGNFAEFLKAKEEKAKAA